MTSEPVSPPARSGRPSAGSAGTTTIRNPAGESGWPNEGAICPCCGNEPSVNDVSVSGLRVAGCGLREKRGYGLAQGAPWNSPGSRPKGWDILEQVKHIPAEWR